MIILRVLTWLAGSLLYVALVEYIAHRHFMHRPLLDRLGLRQVFHEHAILHHRDGRNDLNINLPLYVHCIWGLPSVGIVGLFDLVGALILSAVFVCHSILWTKLHRAIHGLEDNWTMSFRFYSVIEHHHQEHHRRPGKNFGGVFLFTDYLFGTASKLRI